MSAARSLALAWVAVSLVSVTPPLLAQTADSSITYLDHQYQFVIDLPRGWYAYDQNRALGGGMSPYGMVIFAPTNLDPRANPEQNAALKRVATGELPSFLVDRGPASKGMSCTGFSKDGIKTVTGRLKSDPMFGKDRTVVVALAAEDVTVHGCQGVRFRAETRSREGEDWVLDAHAFSDGKVLYLFALRTLKEFFEGARPTYEASMRSPGFTECGGVAVEKVEHQAAASGWKLASEANLGSQRILEYIPEGHKANDWSQIFTVQSFTGTDPGLVSVMEKVQAGIKQACTGVDLKVMDQSDSSIVYEVHTGKCGKNPGEHEVTRLLMGSRGVHRVSFSSTGKDWPEADRTRWLALLSAVHVQPGMN